VNLTISSSQDDSKLECIFRLNKEGRHYLIEDPASVERGVGVLTGVSDDLDCIFFHLRENPSLCTRTTIETISDDYAVKSESKQCKFWIFLYASMVPLVYTVSCH
jgi:hypothetical protein